MIERLRISSHRKRKISHTKVTRRENVIEASMWFQSGTIIPTSHTVYMIFYLQTNKIFDCVFFPHKI